MSSNKFTEKRPDGAELEQKELEAGVNGFAGGDVAKEVSLAVETPKFDSPMLSNEIGDTALALTAENQRCADAAPFVVPKTAEEIAAFFNSFNVDLTNFKFDRDEANER